MSKKTKTWLTVAASLVVLGLLIFGGAMTVFKWDFRKLATSEYETNRYVLEESFRGITVNTSTGDITFTLSEDGKTHVECYEDALEKHCVSVQNGVLEIRQVNEKKWYDYIGIHFENAKIKVALPEKQYGALQIQASTADVEIPAAFVFESVDVRVSTGSVRSEASVKDVMKLQASTGNICVKNISAKALDITTSTGDIRAEGISCDGAATLKVSTGNIQLADFQCKSFAAKGTTGDITMKRLLVAEKMEIMSGTGEVEFDGCDAGEMQIETSTGDVTGSLLSPKIFFAQTSSGKVRVPETTTGGVCRINTSSGDIRITVE